MSSIMTSVYQNPLVRTPTVLWAWLLPPRYSLSPMSLKLQINRPPHVSMRLHGLCVCTLSHNCMHIVCPHIYSSHGSLPYWNKINTRTRMQTHLPNPKWHHSRLQSAESAVSLSLGFDGTDCDFFCQSRLTWIIPVLPLSTLQMCCILLLINVISLLWKPS